MLKEPYVTYGYHIGPHFCTTIGIESEGQKVEVIKLFCGFKIPNELIFLFFNLDHVSISHVPKRNRCSMQKRFLRV